ncbi:50S ribosomal protein L31 type B [Gillisia limnaea]|uniref:50S ribosomal protein L31 type B n=1 Tax=Gillisia limnaea (strain DSM 15749 / LMG 21470 / R-8282) TaxID=865937 RepID=H2BWS3_GILLR|nr:50S ribosomal protein L31 type B [Gillisia limnaea]EHQ04096.1 50S ribosomal protein L31 type B [Gillisia limnaea DSM 15749]
MKTPGIIKAFLFMLVVGCSSDNTEPIPAEVETFSKELFFSEYIEGSSFNKALEIVNLTGASINLETGGYSIKKQTNGSGNWMSDLPLSGSISHNEVYVIANESSDISKIIQQSDLLKTGAPMDFNGNDPIGLFKNEILIDVIGTIDNSDYFARDKTLLRKKSIDEPSTLFDIDNWEVLEMDNIDDLGKY